MTPAAEDRSPIGDAFDAMPEQKTPEAVELEAKLDTAAERLKERLKERNDQDYSFETRLGDPAAEQAPQSAPHIGVLRKALKDEVEYRIRTAVALSKGGHAHEDEVTKGRASIDTILDRAPQRTLPPKSTPSEDEVRTIIESAFWEWFNAYGVGVVWSPSDATLAMFTGPLEASIRALYVLRPAEREDALTTEEAIRESVLAADRIPVVGIRVDTPSEQDPRTNFIQARLRDGGYEVPASEIRLALLNWEAFSRPQTEPSDAQVLAALNAQVRADRRAPDLSYWGDAAVDSMRAALAAAQGVQA